MVWLVLLLWSGCGTTPNMQMPVQGGMQQQDEDIALRLFFSPSAGSLHSLQGTDGSIVQDIDHARQQLRVAIYELTNDAIRDALADAYRRGVDVKIVTDDKERYSEDMKVLAAAGIPIETDEDNHALMHDKFMVIDGQTVWTGSANYTYYAFYRNDENLVRIQSPQVARAYLQEFDELFTHHKSPRPLILKQLEVYFSPEDDIRSRILALIASARRSIDFLAFAFTDDRIAEALIRRAGEGVRIRGVCDERQNSAQKSSVCAKLRDAGIDVRLDGNRFTMHDKVMIIDAADTLTGSYNFTLQADEENSENALIVHNADFAARFEAEFRTIFDAAHAF